MTASASILYNRFFNKSTVGQSGGGISDFQGEAFFKLLQSKKKFLAMIFANLIFQLAITYAVMENAPVGNKKSGKKQPFNGNFVFVFILQIILLLTMVLVPMPAYVKIFLFSLFSALTGYTFSFLRAITDPAVIQTAILATLAIFVSMFIFGALLLTIGIQLGFWFGLGLFLALLSLIIFQIIEMFLGTYSTYSKITAMLGLIIFSLYIVYDTNTILQRNYYGDFITASLDYYFDIINIFLDILRIERQ
jgi:FtsH-binding integral membrane protein